MKNILSTLLGFAAAALILLYLLFSDRIRAWRADRAEKEKARGWRKPD